MRKLGLLLAFALMACDGSVLGTADTGAFSLMIDDDGAKVTATGSARMYFIEDGYAVRAAATGPLEQSDVTSIELNLSANRTLQIAILGALQPGTYTVQNDTKVDASEFYAEYSVPQLGGGRRAYHVTSGTITITERTPTVKARFSLLATRSTLWPSKPPIGTLVHAQPTNLWITGSLEAPPVVQRRTPRR